ncbi:hypothetical protein MUN81_15305 [Hymenobacter sp. 5317J-9]|uniref:hypothetical protein n=1 Tax=Hymenobacter sp. 5317J-9 TaxID=2932250 RepID=UPI001FD641C5|nr:hypothetical protein [Hymenobacter sp. 5317J-9]UOQ96602.1 hypothetical protein MUN81_15305 [Hymenobacter sp. 5317J-9]
MLTFRLDGRPHQVPGGWAELTGPQLLLAAPYLAQDSVAHRLAVLRAWCPALREKDVRRLTPDQLWDMCTLVGWAWQQQMSTDVVKEFAHRGRRYQLPEPVLKDGVAIEYAMAKVYFQQFAHPRAPKLSALDALVATLCRPARADLATVRQRPEWDGQTRERYNAKLAEERALELADAPLGVKIVVLHHFLAAQRFVHRAYRDLFKPEEVPEGPKPAAPKHSDGTEMLELLADVAERGTYGTYEQVAHTSLHTILFNLAKQARHRREAERKS